MPTWGSNTVKTHLESALQALGYLYEKTTSDAVVTRSKIVALLRDENLDLARAQTECLVNLENFGNLLHRLGMQVDLILKNFDELEQSPAITEAASSIIYAGPRVKSKELETVRDILMQRLGPDFVRSIMEDPAGHVSSKVLRHLESSTLSINQIDSVLSDVAKMHGVRWPVLQREKILSPLSQILDPVAASPVNLQQLRKLCLQGLPDDRPWLRPRVWKLLFGTLPVQKSLWDSEMRKQRESYYDLIRRLLRPISEHPVSSTSPSSSDLLILNLSKELSRVPPSLFQSLIEEPESCDICPLDDRASDNIRIACAHSLDSRLDLLEGEISKSGNAESHGESHSGDKDDSRKEQSDGHSVPSEKPVRRRSRVPPSLRLAKHRSICGAHHKHITALLRLLYVHSCLNPANRSPYLSSVLVTLYSVLNQEMEVQDFAHAEADTFWLFEAIVGEFAELEDEEGGRWWMERLSRRLAWADEELFYNMVTKGLDPKLPHYSYRWMASLLVHALPVSSVVIVWDALFSFPMRDRNYNPKLEYLLNICTGMLIRLRVPLLQLGRSRVQLVDPRSPMKAWQLGDAFAEGVSLLQVYPVEAAGGLNVILQTASNLTRRMEGESKGEVEVENSSLGARLKASMWKTFASPWEEEDNEDDNEDSSTANEDNTTGAPTKVAPSGLASRLANTMWKGFTNQSAMEVPSTPAPFQTPPPPTSPTSSPDFSPLSPLRSPSPPPPRSPIGSSLLEKLKDSDAIASLSKAGTNWRAKAMLGNWSLRSNTLMSSPANPTSFHHPAKSASESFTQPPSIKAEEPRRGSLPLFNQSTDYSPPPRPEYFVPPQESRSSSPNHQPPPSPANPENSLLSKTKSLSTSLISLTGRMSPLDEKLKSAPRPLLLNSSSLITSASGSPAVRPEANTSTSQGQWTDVLRMKERAGDRSSQSSQSSLSPSGTQNRRFSQKSGNRSDRESDTGSRVVPLNGRAISPLAPDHRVRRYRTPSVTSSSTHSDSGIPSPMRTAGIRHSLNDPNLSDTSSKKGWLRADPQDSPPTNSPPTPAAPVKALDHNNTVMVEGPGLLLQDDLAPLELPAQTKKITRKKTPPPQEIYDSAADILLKNRERLKRHQQRPASLKMRDQSRAEPSASLLEQPQEHDPAVTPKAAYFEKTENQEIQWQGLGASRGLRRSRKISSEDQKTRLRRFASGGQEIRPKKASNDGQVTRRRRRNSAAEEGDDEGYDELLSAYESGKGHQSFAGALDQALGSEENI